MDYTKCNLYATTCSTHTLKNANWCLIYALRNVCPKAHYIFFPCVISPERFSHFSLLLWRCWEHHLSWGSDVRAQGQLPTSRASGSPIPQGTWRAPRQPVGWLWLQPPPWVHCFRSTHGWDLLALPQQGQPGTTGSGLTPLQPLSSPAVTLHPCQAARSLMAVLQCLHFYTTD